MTSPDDKLLTSGAWDQRYSVQGGLCGAGNLDHSPAGNRQFYRAKARSLDRCLHLVGAGLKGATILDAAGGSGEHADYFLSGDPERVIVADFSPVAFALAARRFRGDPRVTIVLADLCAKPFPFSACHDFVFVLEAVFHLPSDEAMEQALANLAGALKPGGILIISDVFPDHAFRQSPHVVRRARGHFERVLAENGLAVAAYVPQTFLFGRRLFGRLQFVVEAAGPIMYWLDSVAMALGLRRPADDPGLKYMVARKAGRAAGGRA